MPAAEERALKAEAKKKGFKPGSDRYNRYVYGTLQKQKSKKSHTKKKTKSKKK